MALKRPVSPPKHSSAKKFETPFGPQTLIFISLLAITTGISYAPLFSNSFLDFDDPEYITANPFIRSGLTFESWSWAWTTLRAGNWHPLTWISHALDVTLFGLNPTGHHLTSLFIHFLNAALLFLLLSLATLESGRSFVVAALFSLHPLAVESVAWAAERKNVLCTLFFLLTIAAYGQYTRHRSTGTYVLTMVVFGLALASKPMAITLPFVLLLLDFWPLGRLQGSTPAASPTPQLKFGSLVVEKLPMMILSFGSAIITLIAQSSSGAVASIATVSLMLRVENAIYSYFAYLIKAFYPVKLVPFYPHAPLSGPQLGLAVILLTGVTVIAWLWRWNRPYLITGWLFYLGTLVPVIGLVQVGEQAMADRYTYIPLIGIFIAFIWFVDDFARARHLPVSIRAAAPMLASFILAVLTWRQVSLWHDDITLWSHNLMVTRDNVVAEDNLGIALLKQARTGDALPHFYRANQLSPDDPISAANVATDLLANGQTTEAIAKYEVALDKAVFIPMLLPNIHSNLGFAFLKMGNLGKAREHYKLALELDPSDQVAAAGLRRVEQLQSRPSQ